MGFGRPGDPGSLVGAFASAGSMDPGGGGNDALPSGPTTPGDQVRHYDPSRSFPDFMRTPAPSTVKIPGDMPPRLQFEVIERGELGEAIFLKGRISSGDAERFTSFLASLEEAPKVVSLHSPGGNVSEAFEIGRSLRAAELDTTMLPGLVCLSSCPYIFAAGVNRSASKDAAVGMHQHYYDTPATCLFSWRWKRFSTARGKRWNT